MDGYETFVIMVAAIIIGIAFFSIWGLKNTFKKNNSQKYILFAWIVLTVPLIIVDDFQYLGAISGFLLFLYVVWIGVIKPTIKQE